MRTWKDLYFRKLVGCMTVKDDAVARCPGIVKCQVSDVDSMS